MKRSILILATVFCFAACNNSSTSSETSTSDSLNPTNVSAGDTVEVDTARTGTMTQHSEMGNGSGTETSPTGTPDSTK
jgi:ABC-type oligopeptide transport system substrate-binding subunit